MTQPNTEAIKAMVDILWDLTELIRSAGPGGIPSGHLYASLSGVLSLENYQALIRTLKDARLVKESNYLLTYVYRQADAPSGWPSHATLPERNTLHEP